MLTDAREALRYLGCRTYTAAQLAGAEDAAAELEQAAPPRWVWRLFDLRREGEALRLQESGLRLEGRLARRALAESGQAALLVCTLGARFDSLCRAWEKRDMARAALLDACGSTLVEAGCEQAEAEIRARLPGKYLTDRFSPGYGDLPLALQPELLRATDAARRLGVTVTASNMLIPVKTVTTVIGVSERPQPALIRGCAACALAENCAHRREGTTCVHSA